MQSLQMQSRYMHVQNAISKQSIQRIFLEIFTTYNIILGDGLHKNVNQKHEHGEAHIKLFLSQEKRCNAGK